MLPQNLCTIVWKVLLLLISCGIWISTIDSSSDFRFEVSRTRSFSIRGTSKLSQRLAIQKCDEYRQVIVNKSGALPLSMIPEPIEFENHNCTNVVELIIGGEEAKYGEFPHHALLGYSKQGRRRNIEFRCGGTLISDQHVLTAAHCFSEAHPFVVRLGEYDTTHATGDERNFYIADIRRHPQYRNTRPYHDIALVKLASPVTFTKFIRPACLWDTEYRNISRYIATGFGYIDVYAKVLSTKLMKVQLDEFPVEDCGEAFKFNRRFDSGINDGQLCVGTLMEGRDTCQGDSGGPLQTVTSPRTCIYHVVGITSTGSACGIGQAKALYTKVSFYLDWIEDNVWGPNAL